MKGEKTMTVKQISVFVENKPGKLAEFVELLRANGIDMRALSLAEAADFGVLVGVAHRVLIGGVEHFQHTRRVCARFALVEDVLLIIRALGLVRFEYLALGRALLNAENHKRVTWHLSSPLSKRSICIYSPR